MGRSPSSQSDNSLKKGPWTLEEDKKLAVYIQKHGMESWKSLPKKAGLNRCGKSCRLRWTNYLRPGIKRGNFSPEEEQIIIDLHSIHGNKWSTIASHLPGRTDNEIKNFWNTNLRKKLPRSGIDPKTHQPVAGHADFLFNWTNPLDYALKFHADQVTQLACKIQVIQNILQLLRTTPLPNCINGESQNLNSLKLSSLSCPVSTENTENIFMNSMGNYIQEMSVNQCNEMRSTEYSLPALVSASTDETFTVNYQMDSIDSLRIPAQSFASSSFETWENVINDDHASSSFWTDFFN